jgi:pimeloyl-ACP methyl ester carboxylesterase
MRCIVAAFVGLLIVQLCGCSWLDVKQREWALRPTPGRPPAFAEGSQALQDAFRPGDQRWLVTVPGEEGRSDQLALWWLPGPTPSAPTLLYLHGTFRNLYQNLPKIQALRQAGFAIVAVDYRGWGDSTFIIPSEASINADARVAWAVLRQRQRVPGRRVIYGHSMGTATAVSLGATLHGGTDYGALVLESAFTRLPDVAETAGFWGKVGAAVTTLEFDSLSRIGKIDAPILMLHGTADRTVPIDLGQQLREAAPRGVRWVPIAGGSHSELQLEAPEIYQQALADLIRRLPAAPEAPASAPSLPPPQPPPP